MKARQEDQGVIGDAIAAAKEEYEKATGKKVTLTLAKDFLPPSPKNAGPKALQTWFASSLLLPR